MLNIQIGQRAIAIDELNLGRKRAKIDGSLVDFDVVEVDKNQYSLIIDQKSYFVRLHENHENLCVSVETEQFNVVVEDARKSFIKAFEGKFKRQDTKVIVKAPMPGLIIRIDVKKDTKVEAGQRLVVMEAMKMENELTAPVSGTVSKVHAKEQTSIEKETPLLEIDTSRG